MQVGCPAGQKVVPNIALGEFQLLGLVVNDDAVLRALNYAITKIRIIGDFQTMADNAYAQCDETAVDSDEISLEMMRGLFYIYGGFVVIAILLAFATIILRASGMYRVIFPWDSPWGGSKVEDKQIDESPKQEQDEAAPNHALLEASVKQIAADVADLKLALLEQPGLSGLQGAVSALHSEMAATMGEMQQSQNANHREQNPLGPLFSSCCTNRAMHQPPSAGSP